MKISLNITVDICTGDENHKYEISPDNEKIVQLLGLLSELGVANLPKTSKSITVRELFELYIADRMLKDNSVMSLHNAFKKLIRRDDYLNIDISELSHSMIITDGLTMNTKYHYFSVMVAVLNFAAKKGYLSFNFLKDFREYYGVRKEKYSMRKAFSCENWIIIDDAVAVLKPFFLAVQGGNFESEKYQKVSLYYLMLLHMILGTRISETLRVIRNFTPEDGIAHYIYIETKTCKLDEKANFRVVLSDIAVYLINAVKPIEKIKVKAGSNFWCTVRNLLKRRGIDDLSLHGTRAILRTVVDLLAETKGINPLAKEVYLSHEVRGMVERCYQRQDFFIERYKLQIEYAKFLVGTCSEDDELYNIVINDGYIEKIIDNLNAIN